MIDMKLPAATAVLFLASSPVPADERKPADSQERYAPRLNDIMVVMQLRHFKLWYAGRVQNWPLADYELAQIRVSVEDAKNIYQSSGPSNMSMMASAADEHDDAIKAKDRVKFAKAFGKLTAACNACHEATGFGFLKMRAPKLSPLETSPFSNQAFTGR